MSLILAALRKSEAERQRASAPGLFVEQQRAHSHRTNVPAWAWGLVLLLVVVLAAWAWREWQRSASDVERGQETIAVATADPAVQAPPTQFAEPDASASLDPGSLAPITLQPNPAPARSVPATAAAPAPTPAPRPATDAPAAARPTINAPAPQPVANVPPAAEPAAWIPGLGTLAASERAALPPLKLSMHVFADDPAQRFVILDGKRLGEGASPAAGVVLEEIRRDGLVLSVNGQRLLLARP